MNAPLDEELIRLKALGILQSATVHSLLLLVAAHDEVLRRVAPEIGDFAQRFLATQRDAIHIQLERIEQSNPALAATLQQIVDEECKSFPSDYQ